MWIYNQTPSSDDVIHYGILGMRWGVRRSRAQLARANKERKARRKVADYEYKATMARMKKKGLGKDTETIAKAKAKRLAEHQRIENEYSADVNDIKASQKGKNYVMNAFRGAAGGALVGAAYNRSRCVEGSAAVKNILVGGLTGVTLASLKTAKRQEK